MEDDGRGGVVVDCGSLEVGGCGEGDVRLVVVVVLGDGVSCGVGW